MKILPAEQMAMVREPGSEEIVLVSLHHDACNPHRTHPTNTERQALTRPACHGQRQSSGLDSGSCVRRPPARTIRDLGVTRVRASALPAEACENWGGLAVARLRSSKFVPARLLGPSV